MHADMGGYFVHPSPVVMRAQALKDDVQHYSHEEIPLGNKKEITDHCNMVLKNTVLSKTETM